MEASSSSGKASLSDGDFHRLAERVLSHIEATVDRWLQDDVVDIDSQRTGGLLELAFEGGSKIVINTQPPLHELWLAARTGGYHYRWSGLSWVDTRDGGDFFAALSREASLQAAVPLVFAAPQE